MPIDRESALKKAEKFLRQGKLESAIEEYVRLIEDQPRDWNAINALGDLYVRAGDAARAVAQYTRVADHLFAEGFLPRAAALYKKALKADAQHEQALSQLAEIAAQQGVLVDARSFLRQLEDIRRRRGDDSGGDECRARMAALEEEAAAPEPAARAPEPAAPDAGTLFADARGHMAAGRHQEAVALLTRLLTLDADRHTDVVRLALDLARRGRIDAAHACVDTAADAALLSGDSERAAAALQAFVAIVRHVPALVKLVEICVDAGFEARMREAQGRLVDAYLEAGSADEARAIAVDLLEAEPENPAHLARLRHALELLGAPAPEPPARPAPAVGAPAERVIEVDLTEALAAVRPAPTPPAAGEAPPAPEALEAAARDPRTRVRAALQLARLHAQRGETACGIEWLERAADGPFATPDEGFAVLYELADALERAGEPARALAIFIDLSADAGEYRDLRARIDQLARAGSRGR